MDTQANMVAACAEVRDSSPPPPSSSNSSCKEGILTFSPLDTCDNTQKMDQKVRKKQCKRSEASVARHLRRERDRNGRINSYVTLIHDICPRLPTDKKTKETAVLRASQFIQFFREKFSDEEWEGVSNAFIRTVLKTTKK